MRPLAALRLATSSLKAHKLRSALTILGIIIGVASVITMVAIGQGARRQIEEQVRALGTNVVMLLPGFNRSGPVRSSSGGTPLTDRDAAAIARRISGVEVAAPIRQGSAQLIYAGRNWSSTVVGSTADIFVARDLTLAEGRKFSDRESRSPAKVAIVGQTVVKELFAGASPLGQTIRVNRVPMKVIGVLEAKGQNAMGQDQDDTVLVPLKAAQSRLLGGRSRGAGEVNMIAIKARRASLVDQVQTEVDALMRERQRLRPDQEAGFAVRSLSELMAVRTQTTNTMTGLLGAIASVALVVGGIGIMNIMLVSVTERTREIGLRMAVGARPEDILLQFLTEAGLLALIGGVIGVGIALALSLAIAQFAGWSVSIDPAIVLVSLLFSGGVGVVFGFYPARKAARLNPIEALRHD